MSKKIDHIVRQLIAEHEGGESFFDALDDAIREDKDFCEQLFTMSVEHPNYSKNQTIIVATGKFATVFQEWLKLKHYKIPFLTLQGNLRELFNTDVIYELQSKITNFPNVKNAIIIDDSFFSGKTIQSIAISLQSVNINTIGAYVVYDGSKNKYANLHSLFRYYN